MESHRRPWSSRTADRHGDRVRGPPDHRRRASPAHRFRVPEPPADRYLDAVRAIGRFTVRPTLPPALGPLEDLANNLRWSWHQPTQALFASIDPVLWQTVGEDPLRLLGSVSADRLAELSDDTSFGARLAEASTDLAGYLAGDLWYQREQAAGPVALAYFSAEFGVAAVLPQYSGGLGILAGDHLKAASDLGVPLIGVGLLYRLGYFRQSLDRDGWQQERYPLVDPAGLPLTVLREDDGRPVRIVVGLPGGRQVAAQVWVASVGRVPLLMLDSFVEENAPAERDVTDRLYGGEPEHRLQQEMLLGIGGVRALRAYCRITGHPEPVVYHANEGHAGFQGLERIRELTEGAGFGFDAALESVRAGTVFTTHTPVPAGIDRFALNLVGDHFGGPNAVPGVPVERVIELGREDYPGGDPEVFNMAVMGMRLSSRRNGVSLLHGEVSRGMFASLWPGVDAPEVPIASITNGVHGPSWVAPELAELFSASVGDLEHDDGDWSRIDEVPADRLWSVKRVLRARLVAEVRTRLRESWHSRGATDAELRWVDGVLDPDVLTIGFARRVPSYKRLTLMMRDPDRLRRLLTDPDRPVQIVIAGKSHPADEGGKRLIQQIVRFSDDPAVRHRIVFLPDYDISMAKPLYPGCDVWLNNPLRPYEACGTSGMKAALNGGLNLSIRDGWWDEWFTGDNGWAIPSAEGVGDPERRDDLEAEALYDLLETEVTPAYYGLDDAGLPTRWLHMLRNTFTSLGPKVLATRMVRDYVGQLYRPAAVAAAAVSGESAAADLAQWKQFVRSSWAQVSIDSVDSDIASAGGPQHVPTVGAVLTIRAAVGLGALHPDDVRVEVVHGTADAEDQLVEPVATPLVRVPGPAGDAAGGPARYDGQVALDRTGGFGYTVRVVPTHPNLVSPVELGLVRVAG